LVPFPIMIRDTKQAMVVNVLDIHGPDAADWGYRRRSTRPSGDWGAAAASLFKRAKRAGVEPPLRVEWIGDAPADPLNSTEATPPPAEWIDVITEMREGAMVRLRLRLVDGERRPRVVQREIRDDTGEVTEREMRRRGESALTLRIDDLLSEYRISRLLGAE